MAPSHPEVGGGSNPQILQFLSNVLSQRGPTALPYSEDVKWLIRQHLVSLSDAFPSLVPKTATFTHNDGRSVNLLQADGTVPMSYQGVTYNIPVIIWLMEAYPRHAPCVYVNPTRDMIIKRPHPHVDPSGLVRIPYLQNWIYPSSNLVELARNLGSYFALDPPLYSQRSIRTNPNPSPNLAASSSGSVISSGSSGFPAAGSHLDGSRPPIAHNYPPSPYLGGGAGRTFPPSPQVRPPPSQTEDPSEVFKRNAVSKIVDMANGDILALRKTREAEMDGLVNIQQALRRRAGEVDRGLKEMQGEKEALEQQLQMVLMNSDVLEGWLRENEAKMAELGGLDVDVDEVFDPCDVLSKQMLECAHSDLAIEDVIYSLDKAVQDGVIPFDMYLRNVRLLSREQFLNRALGAKVRGAQMQAQVAFMANRAHQYTR